MVYLIIGEDAGFKEKKIAAIKQTHLKTGDARKFDYEVLFSSKLDAETLKKALIALPAIEAKRVVLIYECEKLKGQAKDLVLDFVSMPQNHVVLILESPTLTGKDAFSKKVIPHAELLQSSQSVKTTVFDVTRAISYRKPGQALKLLFALIKEGSHPLQIMGGMVWFWGQMKKKLSSQKFQEGLLVLKEADLNIKRSRLKPEQALEVLVVKLCALLG